VPAIDLSRLRTQAFELAGLLDDPAAFRKFLRSLLDGNSHRLLRRGRSMAGRGALPAWDVPGILIRELETALLPAAGKNNAAVLPAAAAVWEEGRLEEKQLAAYLAGLSRNPADVRGLLLDWLKETEDPVVLRSLAEHACTPLRNADKLLFRSDIRSWIEDPSPSRRRFGWMALREWVEEKTSESVFAAFELLSEIFPETDPESVQLASDLLARLAVISPQEAQGWLMELTPKARQQGRAFLRAAKSRLSGDIAEVLREAVNPERGG
jgi:hypothetical protein